MNLLNACLISTLLLCGGVSADVRQLMLPTKDLVYDRVSQKLYASVPSSAGAMGNSVATIDPETGKIGPFLFVGSEPGKLAVSDDGQFLYVALDGAAAVRRVDLKSGMAGQQFSLGIGQFSGPFFAQDMEVAPGQPQVVAISRRNVTSSPSHEGVAIYDNGVARSKETPRHTGSNIIEFSATAEKLYGLSTEGDGALRRMMVDASGVTVQDTIPAPGLGADIQFDDGLLYGGSGRVFDPEARQLVGTFGPVLESERTASSGALVAPDSSVGRVFFLTVSGQGGAGLRAFDRRTFVSVGSETIPGVAGRPSSLVLWGKDGLAFRTDQGQVLLMRTPLRAPAANDADLSLTATATPEPVEQGAELTLTVTIVNHGPGVASAVRLAGTLPTPFRDEIVSMTASQGRCERTGNGIACALGPLAAGARGATVTLVVRPGTTGPPDLRSWTLDASVSSREVDPNPANNQIRKTVAIQPRGSSTPGNPVAPGGQVRQLAIATRDLVYDPNTRKIYASVPASQGAGGNSVMSIDPETGTLDMPVFVGSEPGKLAVSDDGQYLYVALDGAAAVRRIQVAGQMPGPQFTLGSDSFFGPYYVEDMAVLPGNPNVVAISRKNLGVSPRHAGVALYDNGVARGKATERHTGSNVIEASTNPDVLYGYNNETTEFGFRRMQVAAAGGDGPERPPEPDLRIRRGHPV
jgi:DNA-binding beta-propeller fold protein YncE